MAKIDLGKMKAAEVKALLEKEMKALNGAKTMRTKLAGLQKSLDQIGAAIGKDAATLGTMDE
jgi:hypothetical protein